MSLDGKIKSKVNAYFTHRSSLKVNAMSNWTALGANIIVGFLLTPFIISHLGKTGYGIWMLVGSFVGYYGLLNLGVGSAITRYIARYSAQKDEKSLNKTASTSMMFFCFMGLVTVILSFILAEPIARFFRVEAELLEDFKRLVWITGFTTCISFTNNVLTTIIRAREYFVATNIVAIMQALLRAGMMVIFVYMGMGLTGIAYAALIAIAFSTAATFLLYKYFANDIKIRFLDVNRNTLRMLLVYGGPTTVIAVADIIRINLDSFIIGKWVSLEAVGVYAVAASLIHYATRLITTGMGVLSPRFASLDATGEKEKLRELFLRSMFISSFLSYGAGMLAFMFGGHFIIWWVGEGFTVSVLVLWILMFCSTFSLSQNPAILLMYALKKHHYYAFYTIIEAVANLSLSIILVHKYGIIGVAMGTMIPKLIIKIIVMPVYVSRISGVALLDYLKPILPSVTASISMILLGYCVGIPTLENPTISYLIVVGIIAGTSYTAACYLLTNNNNRIFLSSFLPRRKVGTQ